MWEWQTDETLKIQNSCILCIGVGSQCAQQGALCFSPTAMQLDMLRNDWPKSNYIWMGLFLIGILTLATFLQIVFSRFIK